MRTNFAKVAARRTKKTLWRAADVQVCSSMRRTLNQTFEIQAL
jgi:hypothetical protein